MQLPPGPAHHTILPVGGCGLRRRRSRPAESGRRIPITQLRCAAAHETQGRLVTAIAAKGRASVREGAAIALVFTAIYVAVVGGVGALVQSHATTQLSFVAAAVVALLFQPLLSRARRIATSRTEFASSSRCIANKALAFP